MDHDDFMEKPPPRFYRLAPGRWVRLRYAGFIECVGVERDALGNPEALRCRWAPEAPPGVPIKSTIHWVNAAHAVPLEIRLYERLFQVENPSSVPEDTDFRAALNPHSVEIAHGWGEPCLADTPPGQTVQFERLGYFCADVNNPRPGRPVFLRTVTLKDAWSKARSV